MQKKLIIYQSYICKIGGVETFLYNFCEQLRNYYDILVLYGSGDTQQISRLARLVKLEVYKEDKEYTCDLFIRNSVWGTVPNNIKAPRMIEMRHANYKYLQDKGLLDIQYHPMEGIKEIVACGEFVAKMSTEALGDNPTPIINILATKQKTNKILKLVSCTRLDAAKRLEQNANNGKNDARSRNKVYMEHIYERYKRM